MISIKVPSENVVVNGTYDALAEWLEHHQMMLEDATYLDLDTVQLTFENETHAMLFKLAWA